MSWNVELTNKAKKQAEKLPKAVKDSLKLLMREIAISGPIRGNWANYSKLSDTENHCHIKKGRPTYVAVWREDKVRIRLVEVTYVETHEKAPY
jgi:mRNA-degrading endonuclease RelE of RelBE toxin-antitoxin system